MRFSALLICLLVANTVVFSQKITRTLWTKPMGFNAQWLYLSADGTLIAASSEQVIRGPDTLMATTLWGIDQGNGNVKWKFKPSVPGVISGFDNVPNLPYLRLVGVPLTILDPSDGHVVIDVAAEGATNIRGYGFLYESGHLWLEGTIGGGRCLSIFELSSGKKAWSRKDYFSGPDKSKLSALNQFVAASNNAYSPKLLCAPINYGKDYIIFATGDGLLYNDLFRVRATTGDIEWKVEAPDPNKGKLVKVVVDTSFVRLIPGPRRFFFARTNWLTACNYDDGKQAWNTPVKTTSKVGDIIYDTRGMILCSVSSDVKSMISTGRFRLVSEETGKELWPEPLKFNGGLTKYQYTEKGLAVVTENPESGASNLNFIDVDHGNYTLPGSLHLSGDISSLEVTPAGVFYSTNREVSIVASDGKQLIDVPKNNVLQGTLPVVDAGDKAYVFYKQDQNLYEIDKKNATTRILNKDKIDFKGNDSPDRLEARKDGVMLYSSNNVTYINLDGTTRYSIHYKAVWNLVEKAKLLQALIGVVLEVGKGLMAMGVQQQAALSAPGVTSQQKDQIRNDADKQMRAYAEVGTADVTKSLKAFNDVKLRYEASASAGDVLVVLTTLDHRNILAIMNKDTGETISKIDLAAGDDDPMYQVDPATGKIFYWWKGTDGLWAYETK